MNEISTVVLRENEKEAAYILWKYGENCLYGTVVCHNENFVIIFSNNYATLRNHHYERMVCLVKRVKYMNLKREFPRILGKMVLKDVTSKYFKNPIPSEHLNNGTYDLTDQEKEEIMNFIESIAPLVDIDSVCII